MQSREFIVESDVQTVEIEIMFNSIVDIIRRDCRPFLTASYSPLWRGVKGFESTTAISKKKTYPNRRSRDSSAPLTRITDDWFFNKFGIRFRTNHVVFGTYASFEALQYGYSCLLFPIGEFNSCASPTINDLTSELDNLDLLNDRPLGKKNLEQSLSAARYVTGNEAIKVALEHGTELMIQCKEYYLLNPNHYDLGKFNNYRLVDQLYEYIKSGSSNS